MIGTKMLLCFMLFVIGQGTVQCLTCNELRDMSTNKKLTLQELSMMSPKDINDCLPHIVKERLEIAKAEFIWKKLVEYYQGIPNIPENILAQLNWVTVAIRAEDYANITIASIDTVKNFGMPYNLDYFQLEAIAERVRQDFAGKLPEDYTYYDLKALNQILCAFNRSEIERIHPSAYKESALFIGKLTNCPADVLIGFAKLAVHEDAFGPVDKWTGLILKTIGNVVKYLPGGITKELKTKLDLEKQIIEAPDDSLYLH